MCLFGVVVRIALLNSDNDVDDGGGVDDTNKFDLIGRNVREMCQKLVNIYVDEIVHRFASIEQYVPLTCYRRLPSITMKSKLCCQMRNGTRIARDNKNRSDFR